MQFFKKRWCVYILIMLCVMHNIEGVGFSAGIDHLCTIAMRVCPQSAPVLMAAKAVVKCVGLGVGTFVVNKIRKYRQKKKEAQCTKNQNNEKITAGCFEEKQQPTIIHTLPAVKDVEQYIGCQITVPSVEHSVTQPGFTPAENEQNNVLSFPVVENVELPVLLQQTNTEVDVESKQYSGPWYDRTEDWIKEHPFGQKVAKHLERSQYTNQGKRAYEVVKKIDNCDGFKKGDYVAVDAMHKDHLEVFDKWREWKGVANFDGTKNENKTKQGGNAARKPLR